MGCLLMEFVGIPNLSSILYYFVFWSKFKPVDFGSGLDFSCGVNRENFQLLC